MKPRRARWALAALMMGLAGCAWQSAPLPKADNPAPSRSGGGGAGGKPAAGASDLDLFRYPLALLGLFNPGGSGTPQYADANPASEPIVVGQRQRLPTFGLDRPSGSLDFNYFYEHDREKQSGGMLSSTTDNNSQETATLSDHGYIIHPNFFDWTASGTFGLQQETFDGFGQHQYTAGTLDDWNFNGVFLRNQDVPITMYTQRSEQYITPNFAPSLYSVNTVYGLNAEFHSQSAPSQFQYSHSDSTQTEPGGLLDYGLTQDTAHWHTDIRSLPDHTMAFDYTYQKSVEQSQGNPSIDYQDNDATFSDTYLFGEGKKDSLSSYASFAQEQGNRGYQESRLDENLRLPHSKTFETHYEYSFDQTTIADSTQTTNRLTAGFLHRLYESLVTTGSIDGALLDLNGSAVQQLDGNLDFSYRKKAWDGDLFANLDLGYHWQYSPEGTSIEHVINQPQTFNDPQPIVLTTPNINAGTIRLFTTGGVPYAIGHDFTVNKVGNLIQIQRVLGGLIPADGTVLMDYDLNPQPASTITTGSVGTGLRYTFDRGPLAGLSPYVRYTTQNQQIATASPNYFVPNSYDDLVYGADYKLWRITFNAEQEWLRSTLVPYDATRFSARYNQSFAHDLTASLDAAYESLNYYRESDRVENASVIGTLNRRLNQDWSVMGQVAWIDDRDQIFGNSNGLSEQIELNWHHRQTQVFLRLRNANLNTSQQNDNYQTVEIGLHRNF